MPVVSIAMSRETGTVTDPGVPFHSRLRPITLAEQVGVSAACWTHDVHRSTHYRWKERSSAEASSDGDRLKEVTELR